jgi:hypothetical protein
VPDEAVAQLAVAGTVEDCAGQIARFREAGLEEVILLAVGDAEARGLAVELAGSS